MNKENYNSLKRELNIILRAAKDFGLVVNGQFLSQVNSTLIGIACTGMMAMAMKSRLVESSMTTISCAMSMESMWTSRNIK